MATYRLRFWTENSGFIYFEAADQTEAEEIRDALESGEMFEDELENLDRSTRHDQTEYTELMEVEKK